VASRELAVPQVPVEDRLLRRRDRRLPVTSLGVAEKYTETALHFEAPRLPRLLERNLPDGPLALADFGCGDGPLFRVLAAGGYITPSRSVYAVDLEPDRLARVSARFPWIETVVAPADAVPDIGDRALDFVCSTMVMEHVPDERAYLEEIGRVLRPSGRAYLTTVFKKPWAWYFRRRDDETVLDPSHLREYTDVHAFRALLTDGGLFGILTLRRRQLWFPLLDPILFRLGRWYPGLARKRSLLRVLRAPRMPIPGYYSLEVVLERRVDS
jgi:ubiquinone/menaquinone biosynthesis C-methylase UbiE